MKSIFFIIPVFGLLLSVACAGNLDAETKSQRRINSSTSQKRTVETKEESLMDDYWPFEATLKKEDPFVSELLAIG